MDIININNLGFGNENNEYIFEPFILSNDELIFDVEKDEIEEYEYILLLLEFPEMINYKFIKNILINISNKLKNYSAINNNISVN
jgi:hypothetical protein